MGLEVGDRSIIFKRSPKAVAIVKNKIITSINDVCVSYMIHSKCSVVSEYGPVACCCEHGNETSVKVR
jgi:hypothetical protein